MIQKPSKTVFRTAVIVVGVALSLSAHSAHAACFADYKAKQDAPLKLHYGVAEISGDCSAKNAKTQIAPRLAAQGWTLLQIVSTFGAEGLDQRKKDAGKYFLRF